MENPNLTKSHLFADEMNVDLDVFCSLVVDGIGRHVDGADVVAEDNSGGGQLDVELLEQLSKPAALGHNVSHSSILCLGAGAGHRSLTFGGPGNQIVAKIDAEAGGGSSRVWAACPVSVRVGSQFVDRPGANVETRGESPLDEA